MKFQMLQSLLNDYPERAFRLLLPGGIAIPKCFHITEVGRVQKNFIDCGGTTREVVTCLLQVWVGDDFDHRIETGKMAAILKKSVAVLLDTDLPVEIEYQDGVISQYKIASHEITDGAVILTLLPKQTECLAPELCGLSQPKLMRGIDFQADAIKQSSHHSECESQGCC